MTTALYIRPYGFEVGSVYKYREMFRRAFSTSDRFVDIIAEDEAGVIQAIRDFDPDLCIVGGDWWWHWRACHIEGVPYIVVEHDVMTLRDGEATTNRERRMLSNAAGVLFTSPDHADYCAERYDLPPFATVPLRPLKTDIDFEPRPKLEGKRLVYAGGLCSWADRQGIYGYRAYHRIFESFMRAGWVVDIFPCYTTCTIELLTEFMDIGCIVHPQVPQYDLPAECSRFTAGFHGYANEGCDPTAFAYTQTCRPNKTWEYLAAGIPTIGYQSGNSGEVFDGRWGVVVPDLEPETIADVHELVSMPDLATYRKAEVLDGFVIDFRVLVELAMGETDPLRSDRK